MKITTTTLPNGDVREVRTIPGAAPLVYINGVIQPIATVDYGMYPWRRWFAWRPVRVHGSWTWGKWVYRRPLPKTYATMDDWEQYEYGSIFDVLTE